MLVLVSYDISVVDPKGQTRLRRVAKTCKNYGRRVQNSLFECQVDYADFLKLKDALLKIMDQNSDSIRFYRFGQEWQSKTEHFGIKPSFDLERDTLIF